MFITNVYNPEHRDRQKLAVYTAGHRRRFRNGVPVIVIGHKPLKNFF